MLGSDPNNKIKGEGYGKNRSHKGIGGYTE